MKNNINLQLSCSLLLTACYSLSFAAVWYVHPDSVMSNIDAALDSCAQNDTVLVGPGTYYENIWWPPTKGICLISEYGPDTTIIDGQQSGRTVYIPSDGADALGMLHGFTIQNGRMEWVWGAGVYCLRDTFTISGNIIINNEAYGGNGGGIGCYFYGAPIIKDNVITGNKASRGGGIGIERTSPILTNNLISGNRASEGGGMYIGWDSWVVLRDNIFDNDTAFNGGALWIDDGHVMAVHSAFNMNFIAGAVHKSAGISLWNHGTLAMDSCNLFNNHGNALDLSNSSTAELHYCNIAGNTGYGVYNGTATIINAEYNWWGDSTGPYHPDSNPGGLGDSVSDLVDFIPWLYWPGVEDRRSLIPVMEKNPISSTIFAGPLLLPEDKQCKVIDITGRVVMPDKIKPGIYFIEVDGEIRQKVVKIR
jgi:hypothetical protein